jgi:hypothetical protein
MVFAMAAAAHRQQCCAACRYSLSPEQQQEVDAAFAQLTAATTAAADSAADPRRSLPPAIDVLGELLRHFATQHRHAVAVTALTSDGSDQAATAWWWVSDCCPNSTQHTRVMA